VVLAVVSAPVAPLWSLVHLSAAALFDRRGRLARSTMARSTARRAVALKPPSGVLPSALRTPSGVLLSALRTPSGVLPSAL